MNLVFFFFLNFMLCYENRLKIGFIARQKTKALKNANGGNIEQCIFSIH